jgi:hypothetical protein
MEKVDSSLSESFSWPALSDACDPYTFDLAHYTRLLRDNSERLFVQDAQLWIKVIQVGEQGSWQYHCRLFRMLADNQSRRDLQNSPGFR